jgi:argininosuccinate lyase
MSHAAAWQRDDMRLRDLMPRVATLPLGSGALAGNPFLVDRQFIAKELDMVGGVCPNSMDAVSDRKSHTRLSGERGRGAGGWLWTHLICVSHRS